MFSRTTLEILTENDSVYNYRKIVNGIKTDTPHYSLTQALADEHWDYVSFQQASHFSGMPLTYAPFLDELMKYVRQNVNDSTKFMFHSTWAYSQDSKHPGFANYSCSQNVMFDEIIGTTEMVMDAYHFDILIPCGTRHTKCPYIDNRRLNDSRWIPPKLCIRKIYSCLHLV